MLGVQATITPSLLTPNDKRQTAVHSQPAGFRMSLRSNAPDEPPTGTVRAATATGRFRPALGDDAATLSPSTTTDVPLPTTIYRLHRRPRRKMTRAHPQTRTVNHPHPHARHTVTHVNTTSGQRFSRFVYLRYFTTHIIIIRDLCTI